MTYLETTKFGVNVKLDTDIVIVIYGYGLGEFHEYFWVGYPKMVVTLGSFGYHTRGLALLQTKLSTL